MILRHLMLLIILIPLLALQVGITKKWKASITLTGKNKSYVLESNSIYGGFNDPEKRLFLFGKNHIFVNKEEQLVSKLFSDMCVTNASGQFQLEVNGLVSNFSSKEERSIPGFISLKKKKAVLFKVSSNETNQTIVLKSNIAELGILLTEEAKAN